MNRRSEEQDFALLEELTKEYRQLSTEEPSAEIDKQIIAAAYREIEKPQPRSLPRPSWWRRLNLPIYAVATLAFTAIGTQILFQEPVRVPPGTAPSRVNIQLIDDTAEAPKLNLSPRQKRELPEYHQPPVELTNTTEVESLESNQQIEKPDQGSNASEAEQNLAQAQDASRASEPLRGNHTAKLEFPDKEAWARQVLALFREGEYDKAKKELVRFKKVYPDYPIDAQIEALKSL